MRVSLQRPHIQALRMLWNRCIFPHYKILQFINTENSFSLKKSNLICVSKQQKRNRIIAIENSSFAKKKKKPHLNIFRTILSDKYNEKNSTMKTDKDKYTRINVHDYQNIDKFVHLSLSILILVVVFVLFNIWVSDASIRIALYLSVFLSIIYKNFTAYCKVHK